MSALARRTATISHHRVNIGNPIKEIRRVMFDQPIQVIIGCIMFDPNNKPSYSGVDQKRFTPYTFEQEDILSEAQLTEAGCIQLDSTAEEVRRLLGLVSNLAYGQQDIRAKLSEYQQITALSPTKDQDSIVQLHLLQTIVSDLAKGIEEQSKQTQQQLSLLNTRLEEQSKQISTIQQQLQAQQAPIPRKSLFSFFSSQTK